MKNFGIDFSAVDQGLTPSRWIDRLMKPLPAALILATLLAIVAPMKIVVANWADFETLGIFHVVAQSPLHFIAVFAVALTLFWVTRKVSTRVGATTAAWAISYFVLTSLYFSLRSGKLDGIDILSFNTPLLLGLLIVLTPFAIALPRIIFSAALVFSLSAAVPVFIGGSNLNPIETSHSIPSISPEKNVFVIMYDSIMSGTVHRALAKNDKLKDAFRGFVSFENAVAGGPYTFLSLQTLKAGRLYDSPSSVTFGAEMANTQITTELKNAGYAVNVHGVFSQHETEGTNHIGTFLTDQEVDGSTSAYSTAVSAAYQRSSPFEQKFISGLWETVSGSLDAMLKGPDAPIQATTYTPFDPVAFEAVTEAHPHPLAYYAKGLYEFRSYANNLSPTSKAPTANFFHFTHTHDPIMLSPDCSLNIYTREEQIEALDGEVECALNEFAQFLDLLKSAGAYDNSLIILAGDHGYECGLTGINDSPVLRVSQRWCLSRYMPSLIVKLPNATEAFQVNKFETSLLDIPSTICGLFLDQDQCTTFEGADLSADLASQTDKPRNILLPLSEKDIRDFSNFETIDVKRSNGLEQRFGFGNVSYTDGIRNGTPPLFTGTGNVLPRTTGRVEGRTAIAEEGSDGEGYVSYGPYISVPAGEFEVRIRYESTVAEALEIGSVDAVSSLGESVHYIDALTGSDGEIANLAFRFSLDAPVKQLEVRTQWNGTGDVRLHLVQIEQLTPEQLIPEQVLPE